MAGRRRLGHHGAAYECDECEHNQLRAGHCEFRSAKNANNLSKNEKNANKLR